MKIELEKLRIQVKELKEDNKQFKLGYKDLCLGYDNLKKLIHEISVRQGNHIERSDNNFLRIDNFLKRLGL